MKLLRGTQLFNFACATLALAGVAHAQEANFDWDKVEFGLIEEGEALANKSYGLAVHIPASSLLNEAEFNSFAQVVCNQLIGQFLEIVTQTFSVGPFEKMKLQVEVYGPEIGESQAYVAQSAMVLIEEGKCNP
ncbi:MAG: hypothetical protein MK098_07145 [Marinovum sp.]|nr:hypothetical protein [Marinovum sp.]